MTKIERTEPLKVAGRLVQRMIREEYQTAGRTAALILGHSVLVDATDEQILKLATGRAELRGISPDTEYRDLDD